MKDVLRTHGIERPITVVPTGIDRREFTRGDGAALRRRHGVSAERPMLVYVGRVAHEKNLDFLLDMLAALRPRLPGVLLALAGEGPAAPHLRRRVRKLGLADTVLFVGYLRRDGELQDCYTAGDLFVFASRTETQGLVLLEALARRARRRAATLGTREIVLPGRGACAAPDDPAGFAMIVEALLRDPGARLRMAQEGPVFAAEWDTAAAARRLVAVYESLTRAPGVSPAETVSARA